MLYEYMKAGSQDWFAVRIGKVTASNASAVIGTPTARRRYMDDLALEILTGHAQTFTSPSVAHGKKFEPIARREYEFITGNKVDTPAFWVPDEWNDRVGYSPDGCTLPLQAIDIRPCADFRWDRLLEIKCPVDPTVHINAILDGIPKKNIAQCQFALWSTKRETLDFVSFSPYFPPKSQLHLYQVEANPEHHEVFDEKVPAFIEELDRLVAMLDDDDLPIERLNEELSSES